MFRIPGHHSRGPGLLLTASFQWANPFCLLSCVDRGFGDSRGIQIRKILQGHGQKLDFFFFNYFRQRASCCSSNANCLIAISLFMVLLGPARDWWPQEKRAHASKGSCCKRPWSQSAEQVGSLGLVQWPLDSGRQPGTKMLYSWEFRPAFQPEDVSPPPARCHKCQTLAKGQTKESKSLAPVQQELRPKERQDSPSCSGHSRWWTGTRVPLIVWLFPPLLYTKEGGPK